MLFFDWVSCYVPGNLPETIVLAHLFIYCVSPLLADLPRGMDLNLI